MVLTVFVMCVYVAIAHFEFVALLQALMILFKTYDI